MLDKMEIDVGSGLDRYFKTLYDLLRNAAVTDRARRKMSLDQGCAWIRGEAHEAHDRGNKIMIIGNGGSAGIASHLAIDFSKNGGLRAMAFNDPSALTCLGNDFGFENVFAKQVEFQGRSGDLLIAISSSGRSSNILNAAKTARSMNCKVATFSGFTEDNDLRNAGDINFFVQSAVYGLVEVAHLTLCHAFLDLDMGWAPNPEAFSD